ncbi:hypothetical protein GCK72_019482 [Caenorhabditis remanei]|uniref:Uncharacterized protein n=1 Tax=Caenorhabditis remanei TaxID=31234 RepID=A0A2P4VTZ5_CAERE|nr:hypothetical protein GCK72_019482 [Caenorhabditis remanei]KAF1752927.1 hypothetical protein GCK72_019482 [Caenorhabditis remanei]
MLAVMNPSTSNTVFHPSYMPKLSEENCAVCGDQVKSSRLGCPACLSCMIFFRRSVIKNAEYKCPSNKDCPIFHEYRSSCRYCRFQKCFLSGMKSSAVVTRDKLGPRSPTQIHSDVPKNLMGPLTYLQQKIMEEHQEQTEEPTRRATVSDVNRMFKWSFNDAVEWASQFEPFLRLTNEEQKCVISEYGFAFFIIDQGVKSAKDWRSGYWILQNATFLHVDYFQGLENISCVINEDKIRFHSEFVAYLETSIKRQIQILQIDEFEIAALKTLLLFSSTFPKRNIFSECQDKVENFKNKCLEELMTYLMEKYPTSHETRFGKLILFIGDIRAAIKVVYNQTKVSDLFDTSKFDMFVRSFFLS